MSATRVPSGATARLGRLARAISSLERLRDRVESLDEMGVELRSADVIVIDGEVAVLTELRAQLDQARRAINELETDPGDAGVLARLEDLVAPPRWSVLDDVASSFERKQGLREVARGEVRRRCAEWSNTAATVVGVDQSLKERQVVLPRNLVIGRDRLTALVARAAAGLRDDKLLDAWQALDELEEAFPSIARTDDPPPVAAAEVLPLLTEELTKAWRTGGRVQLTVLRGPRARDRFEYTLMLLAPGGDRRVGVNVQDSSTIVVQDRKYFLQVVDEVGGTAYRGLRQGLLRDGRKPMSSAPMSTAPERRKGEVARLEEMGAVLYKLLIPDRMKEELDHHPETAVVITTNDLELPWELMYEGEPGKGHFMALQRPMARMPVGRSRGRATVDAADRPPRRQIALIASLGPKPQLKGALDEILAIRDRLKDEKNVDITVLTSRPDNAADLEVVAELSAPDGGQFRNVLLSGGYDIVHYAGHAAFDRDRPDQSGLVLDGDEVCFAQKIQRLLRGNPLVFLNACESARLKTDDERPPPEGTYEGDPRDGLASAFVYGGALACIGATWPVSDLVAADFAVSFYRSMLAGHALGPALLEARKATAATSVDDPSWAAFVLYGDPAFRLTSPGAGLGLPPV